MIIEREDNTIVIKPNGSVNMDAVQKVIDYINVLEIISANEGSTEAAAKFAEEVDSSWWKENRKRFLP